MRLRGGLPYGGVGVRSERRQQRPVGGVSRRAQRLHQAQAHRQFAYIAQAGAQRGGKLGGERAAVPCPHFLHRQQRRIQITGSEKVMRCRDPGRFPGIINSGGPL